MFTLLLVVWFVQPPDKPEFLRVPVFEHCEVLQAEHTKRLQHGDYVLSNIVYRPITNLLEPTEVRLAADLNVYRYILAYMPVSYQRPCY